MSTEGNLLLLLLDAYETTAHYSECLVIEVVEELKRRKKKNRTHYVRLFVF
jgi:hypothetical protein